MRRFRWEASQELVALFRAVGRALLLNDMEDSHSGNIAMRWKGQDNQDYIVITATGSQKGDLDAGQICFLSTEETDFGYYKASSETDIHARILDIKGVNASIHAHTKDLTIMTLDDAEKPNQPEAFMPIDPLGFYHLGGMIPVDWVEVPSGSAAMAEIIPDRLKNHKATVIQGHGTFTHGRTLREALYRACLANNSGYIARQSQRLGIPLKALRQRISQDPEHFFTAPPPAYTPESSQTFRGEEEIVAELHRTGARIFESRLSPFHTGSISVRGVSKMLYAPNASMPRDLGGPLLEMTLSAEDADDFEISIHKQIYAHSQFQTILHCHVPEAEVAAHIMEPGKQQPVERIIPIDAEGSFLYIVIPLIPARFEIDTLIRLLHDYKVVIVRGGGVWGVGAQSLSEVLHHPSSVREICLYRFGAMEQGLDLTRLEPKQADKW